MQDKLLIIISNIKKKLKYLYLSLCKKIKIFYHKHKYIEALYNPLLKEKIENKNTLTKNISLLNHSIKSIDNQCKDFKNENLRLKNSISTLQNLLIYKNNRA